MSTVFVYARQLARYVLGESFAFTKAFAHAPQATQSPASPGGLLSPARALLVAVCVVTAISHPAIGSVFVGNPTNVTLAPITGVSVTGFALPLAMVETRPCNASTGPRNAPVLVDGKLELYIPEGTCELRLEVDDTVLVSGSAVSGGAPIDLELDTPTTFVLVFDAPFDPADEDDRYVVEFGMPGWTSASQLLPNGASSADVGPGDPLHAPLVNALVAGTALFADPDGDGVVSSGERTPGPLAETP